MTRSPRTSTGTSPRRRAGIAELGVSEHIYRFKESLEIWQHADWQDQAVDDLGAYCEFVRTTPLRLGIEADFIRGAEDRTATLLEEHGFDYVVGSVHYLGDLGAVDDQRYDVWKSFPDADSLWGSYFEWQAELALGSVRHRLPSRPGQDLG
jgi:histidinol-phosphatase (PHP family)